MLQKQRKIYSKVRGVEFEYTFLTEGKTVGHLQYDPDKTGYATALGEYFNGCNRVQESERRPDGINESCCLEEEM